MAERLHLHRRIHLLMVNIWSASDVPNDWRGAQIVPIPKKVIFIAAIIGKESVCWT